jgi:hypothetical protein
VPDTTQHPCDIALLEVRYFDWWPIALIVASSFQVSICLNCLLQAVQPALGVAIAAAAAVVASQPFQHCRCHCCCCCCGGLAVGYCSGSLGFAFVAHLRAVAVAVDYSGGFGLEALLVFLPLGCLQVESLVPSSSTKTPGLLRLVLLLLARPELVVMLLVVAERVQQELEVAPTAAGPASGLASQLELGLELELVVDVVFPRHLVVHSPLATSAKKKK